MRSLPCAEVADRNGREQTAWTFHFQTIIENKNLYPFALHAVVTMSNGIDESLAAGFFRVNKVLAKDARLHQFRLSQVGAQSIPRCLEDVEYIAAHSLIVSGRNIVVL